VFVALGNKLDVFAKMLQLHPIDKDGRFKGKLKSISHDELKPVLMICPDAVECETMSCNPRSLLQTVRPQDIPEVTLIKGTEIYKKSYVHTGLCPQCQTQYSCSLPSPTDSRWSPGGLHKSMWSPDGVHLKKISAYNSVQNPYGLHMDSYGLHLESTWNPSCLQMD
jgi:hypothetical protein